MKQKLLTLFALLAFVGGGNFLWATTFTFDVSTDFNSLTDAQKNAIISNGITSDDGLVTISFSNPGTDFQRDVNGIKMRGGSGRNATITINGSVVAKISGVALTYYETKRNIVSDPEVDRSDNDTEKTMSWTFSDVNNLSLSQNIGNTVLTKIEVTYSATDITQTVAIWDFANGNPATLATESINSGIENSEADVTSSVSTIKMHVNTQKGAAYADFTGKLRYRSSNGDAQCNKGTIMQIPVKGTLDVVSLNPKNGSYTIAGGAEVTSKTNYTATSDDVAQGYVEIVCSESGYLYSISVTQYSASIAIGAYQWATFVCSQALDFTNSGVNAYIVTGATGTSITKSDALTTVPANTPLLLNAAEGTYTIPVTASSSTDVSANKLIAGTGVAIEYDANSGYNYVLGVENSAATFLKIVDGTPATVPPGKAYLALTSAPAGARAIGLGNNVTAVKNLIVDSDSNVPYNLQGCRVKNPSKGLYIVNGKKVIIK